MPIKTSELIVFLQKHQEKYGDATVMIYDDYISTYKSFNSRHLSVMPGGKFVIQCDAEEEI